MLDLKCEEVFQSLYRRNKDKPGNRVFDFLGYLDAFGLGAC